jgi:hypothetical protein
MRQERDRRATNDTKRKVSTLSFVHAAEDILPVPRTDRVL